MHMFFFLNNHRFTSVIFNINFFDNISYTHQQSEHLKRLFKQDVCLLIYHLTLESYHYIRFYIIFVGMW